MKHPKRMIGDAVSPEADLPPGVAEIEDDPKTFVLNRELAEVHLLIENVSTSPDKSLSIKPGKDDGLSKDWIEQICEIDWPPEPHRVKAAKQADLLIRAKDFLNRQAKPASGATIAFTVLVAEARRKGDAPHESRASLAQQAYPELMEPARFFSRFSIGMQWFVFGCLILTCLTSWYAAFGAATLSQRVVAQRGLDAAEARLDEAEASANNGTSKTSAAGPNAGGAGSDQKEAVGATSDLPLHATRLCQRSALLPLVGKYGPQIQQFYSESDIQVCDDVYKSQYDVQVIDRVLTAWLPPPVFWPKIKSVQAYPGHNVAASVLAGTLLNLLGGAVLPVLYGLLGAGAAVVRSLSRKFKESRLSPRDTTLSLQQLALGAVTGSCISLFVAQPAAGGQPTAGLISAVALSSSALSFVAGFGVEQVFATVEMIMRRVFPGDTPTPAAKPG